MRQWSKQDTLLLLEHRMDDYTDLKAMFPGRSEHAIRARLAWLGVRHGTIDLAATKALLEQDAPRHINDLPMARLDTTHAATLLCLRCRRSFASWHRVKNRLCATCANDYVMI
jgi:hypothetical protein